MAIVVYKCDVCKRSIELQRNIEGLERIHRCTITQGCRGKLYQTKLLPDYIRGGIPDDVTGLDNWVQRKVLHNHTQAIERDEWIIEHNMGSAPIVSVFVNRPIEGDLEHREEVTPEDIIYRDEDTVVLRFDRPWSGIAQLVGRQSDPNLLRPYERAVETTAGQLQLSTRGEITIATAISKDQGTPAIGIRVLYETSTGTSPTVTYTVDDQPALNSPWLDVNKVIIKGKIYTVRSYNAVVSEMTTGIINSGATFRFTEVDWNADQSYVDIAPGQMLILLASDPYQIIDKQKNQFIDVTSVTASKNPFGFFYDSGELFADPNIVQTVYPLIRSV